MGRCARRCGGGAMRSLPWMGWWCCGALARHLRGNRWDAGVGAHHCLVIVGSFSINGGHGQLSDLLSWARSCLSPTCSDQLEDFSDQC